jgi:DNA-binding NtrC family response regulator
MLKTIKEQHPDTLVILLTAYSSIDTAVTAMREGAYHYARKPFDVEEIAILGSGARTCQVQAGFVAREPSSQLALEERS